MAVNLNTEIAKVGNYPLRFNKREQKLLESVAQGTGTFTNKTLTAPVVTTGTFASPVVTTPVIDGDQFGVATGTISSAEVLALNATPITLIAAPGAGKTIIVDEIQLFLDYGSADYAADAGEDLTFQYATGNVAIAAIDNDAVAFLTASADAHWFGQPGAVYDVQAAATGDGVLLTTIDNEAIEVTIATGEVITGDSPIKWRIKYRVIDSLT